LEIEDTIAIVQEYGEPLLNHVYAHSIMNYKLRCHWKNWEQISSTYL